MCSSDLGIALLWVLARFAIEISTRRVAVVAVWIAALYPNFWMNDGLVMSESISVLLVALSLWAAWRAVQRPGRSADVMLGVSLGLAVLARSELVVCAPLVILWVVWSRRKESTVWKPALLTSAVVLGVLAPWVTFNMVRFERAVVLTTNDGTTLLGANCPDTYSGSVIGGWTIDCVSGRPDYDPAEEPSVRSARQRSQALSFVAHHLGSTPKVVAARVLRTLDLYGLGNLVQQDVGEERPRWAVWLGIGMFWLLAPLAAVGARFAQRPQRLLLVAPFLSVLVTTVLFYGAHRIRSSAEPSIVLLAAIAVSQILDRRRTVPE